MDDVRQRLPSEPTRFIDQLRLHVRNSGLAYQTEKTYIHWIKRFIYFNNKQQASINPQGLIAFATVLLLTYSNQAMTCGPFKNCWGILISQRQRFIPMSLIEEEKV